MLEKDIENLIAKYPQEFFPKETLTLKGQQVSIVSRRIDVLFEDKHGRFIVIEVKRGILNRDAAGQIIEYYGLLKQYYPGKVIELILCANVIPPERRTFLEQVGIECKEIGALLIADVAQRHGYKFLDELEKQGDEKVTTSNNVERQGLPGVEEAGRDVWIFQANPLRYDIFNALSDSSLEKDTWLVARYKDQIKRGDLALIWVSGKDAGIYAVAEIISDPALMFDDPGSEKYWLDEEDRGQKQLRVEVKIVTQFINRPIFRHEIREVEGLKSLSILKFAQGTNFQVTQSEWRIIKETFLSKR